MRGMGMGEEGRGRIGWYQIDHFVKASCMQVNNERCMKTTTPASRNLSSYTAMPKPNVIYM